MRRRRNNNGNGAGPAGWEKKDYERDKAFAAEQKLTEGADEVFVNGDSVIPGARSLDPVLKGRMFTGVQT